MEKQDNREKGIVNVEHLSHKYSRDWAIRDISFSIDRIGVVGLLGSNGAGKSTTMNIICGVLNQTEGKVFINGVDLRESPFEAKKMIGFLPQNAPLHLDLTVKEYLVYCARLRLLEKKRISPAVEDAMDRCGISHFRSRLIRNLSGGYRQRVGIAQAILHQPQLVVLDEPTNGLDPNQIGEVRKLIAGIGQERSVIFSSHILSEIQATCRYVKMIEHGRMVFEDTMDAFNNYIDPDSMVVAWDNPPSIEDLKSIARVESVEPLHGNYFRLRFNGPPDIAGRIIGLSVANGWNLTEIMLEKSSLDEIFAQLSHRNKDKRPL